MKIITLMWLVIALSFLGFSKEEAITFTSTENSIRFSFKEGVSKVSVIEDEKEAIVMDTVLKTIKLEVGDLPPATNYTIKYTYNEKIYTSKANTLASNPRKAIDRIVKFNSENEGELVLKMLGGKGEKMLVVGGIEGKDWKPSDGQEYPSEPGKVLDDSIFVIYNGVMTRDYINIDSLNFGRYKVFGFAYNGEGKFSNYLLDSAPNNPRLLYPKPPAPKAVSYEYDRENVFTLLWEGYDYVNYYELQVSRDEDFANVLGEYNNADVGDGNSFAIYIEDLENIHYWRVRAVTGGGISNYSNSMRFGIEK